MTNLIEEGQVWSSANDFRVQVLEYKNDTVVYAYHYTNNRGISISSLPVLKFLQQYSRKVVLFGGRPVEPPVQEIQYYYPEESFNF